jgi:toxin FitB
MYLIDTDVINEARKGEKANAGVRSFFRKTTQEGTALYLCTVTIGELRRGVETIRHRGDAPQAARLERWLDRLSLDFGQAILSFDQDAAHVWGRLRAPHAENPLDKQIAATALIHDLVVVTRNVSHYETTGVRLLNPFD